MDEMRIVRFEVVEVEEVDTTYQNLKTVVCGHAILESIPDGHWVTAFRDSLKYARLAGHVSVDYECGDTIEFACPEAQWDQVIARLVEFVENANAQVEKSMADHQKRLEADQNAQAEQQERTAQVKRSLEERARKFLEGQRGKGKA